MAVTLNGRPAYVRGNAARHRFAQVVDAETGLSAEWSWEAVEHVLSHSGGKFASF